MSVGLIVILFTSDILLSDQFNEQKENIYRITTFSEDEYRAFDFATCPVPMGKEVIQNFPGIKSMVELRKTGGSLDYNGKQINGSGLFAGKKFFNIFSYELISGSASSVLKNTYTLVITEKLAKKLFYPEDPIGKVVKVEHIGVQNYRDNKRQELQIPFSI